MKEEALKLADWLEDGEVEKYDIDEASAMIRRLVEELDKQTYKASLLENRLKVIVGSKLLSDGEIDESFDRTASHMANEYVSHYEPAAWINHIKQTGGDFYELNVSGRGEPLYRHPPQTKPLSDEEIDNLIECHWDVDYNSREQTFDYKGFARAIEERHGIK